MLVQAAHASCPAEYVVLLSPNKDSLACLVNDLDHAPQAALAQAAHASCSAEYDVLTRAIKDPSFRATSKQFSQPWKH